MGGQARSEDWCPPRFAGCPAPVASIEEGNPDQKEDPMRTPMVLGLLATLALTIALTALPAEANSRGGNGRIAFARFDPALNDTVLYTVNPDGTQERKLQKDPLECPNWSPDGKLVSTCGDPSGAFATRLVNPDDGSFRQLPMSDPAHTFMPCFVWAQRGARLVCEGLGPDGHDTSVDGLYSVRSSDGGGLRRITFAAGGDDNPGSSSPDGRRIVFARTDKDHNAVALFVVNVNGKRLKQITPTGTLFSSQGDWSSRRNEIVFSQRVTADVHSTIWIVHPDGSGLRRVDVQGSPACGGPNSDPKATGCFGPQWSPDGSKIVFARGTDADTDSNIYTVNADGSGLTQVTHGGRDQFPDWGTHALVH
jgi:Tol biopolymer transport system component